MKHVLITRFALRFEEGNPRRRYEGRDWVDYRMELFKKYTLPSVQAQTFQDFDWYFLVDFNFPGFMNKHTKELNRYGKCLFMTDSWNENQVGVGEMLAPYYKDEWVCSTRLDSDDIIHNDFMKMISENAQEKNEWLSFPDGYMVKASTNKVREREYPTNPFLSYVEYADPFMSVMHINHIHIEREGLGMKRIMVPAWIQVDHGDNIKNHVNDKFRTFDDGSFDVEELADRFTWKEA